MSDSISSPLLSVVIATYNRASELDRCIKSVLAETGNFFEVIVGDDASPDHTQEVIKSYLGDPRLRHYRNEVNLGLQENVLKVVRFARGDYIFILTDDDYLLPRALNIVIEIIKMYPEVGYILSHLPMVDARTGKIINKHHTFKECKLIEPTIPNMISIVPSAWVLSRQVLKRDSIDWKNWEQFRSNIFFPIIVAGRILLKSPCYYIADNLVMHTQFNKVYWEAFGRNELEIEFNLALNAYKCMAAIFADSELTLEGQRAIHQWEMDALKSYLYRSPRGFYDLAKSFGLREGLKKLIGSYQPASHQLIELGFFPFKIIFFRAWFNLKVILSKLSSPIVDTLKDLRSRLMYRLNN